MGTNWGTVPKVSCVGTFQGKHSDFIPGGASNCFKELPGCDFAVPFPLKKQKGTELCQGKVTLDIYTQTPKRL